MKLDLVFVTLLAGAVRLTHLGQFLAIDEEDRWNWAVAFYNALLRGDLPGTLVGDGYPGIFPAWLETIWLFIGSVYRSILQGGWIGEAGVNLLTHEWERTSHLALQRFPVVLANTVFVSLIFLYIHRLFGRRVALVAGILIALDPFYLSDSRVNRAEALLAGLMTLSMLSLLVSLRETNRRQLIVSGIFAGLAWLTKSQSLVLGLMFAVIMLVWWLKAEADWLSALRCWLLTLLGWAVVAGLTFIVLWPATWTAPAETFGLMLSYATRKVGAEGINLFFLGRTLLDEDPGPLFYPLIFLLRITPLTLLGLLLGGWWTFDYLRRQPKSFKNWRCWLDEQDLWVLLAYCLLYAGGMTLGSHKQDRFLMAIFPMLGILAGLAFIKTFDKTFSRPQLSMRRALVGLALLLGLQLITVLPYHPYYFTYFNPLLGGGAVASRLTRVGWGEGMDQAAAYLNSLDNAKDLYVAARWYNYLVGFKGKTDNIDLSMNWLQADKIVFYIQQVQRMQDPSPGIVRYFQDHVPPEKVITINGIDYGWIYPNPVVYPANPKLEGIRGQLALLGYDWLADDSTIKLIWENLGAPPESLAVRLWRSDASHSNWYGCQTAADFAEARQRAGEIVESRCPITDLALPPGFYSLQLGLDAQPFEFAAGRSALRLTDSGELVHVEPETAFAQLAEAVVPPEAIRLPHTYAYQIHLLAYELSAQSLQPGQSLDLTLYWQAIAPIRNIAHVSVQAFVNNQPVINLNGPPLKGEQPTNTWQPGDVFSETWTVDFPADFPSPALVTLGVGLFDPKTVVPWQVRDQTGIDIPNAVAEVRLLPIQWPMGQGEYRLDYTFDDKVRLSGYDFQNEAGANSLDVTLYWRSLAPLADDYVTFVHLLNEEGQLVVQSDVPPQGGNYPTTAWQPGQIILSYHHLELPAALEAGTYTLLAGLYRPNDWSRLPVVDSSGSRIPDNAVPIREFQQP